MPNPVSPPKTPPEPDNDCITCTGISYFSGAMKAQGKMPMCFGLSAKSKHQIPEARMKLLEKLPIVKPNAKVYHVGVSQSSVRMNKTGKVPILIFGVEINMNEDPVDNRSKSSATTSEKEKKGGLFNHSNMLDPEFEAIVRNFPGKLMSSGERQLAHQKKLYDRITDQLPDKMQRSALRFIHSTGKTWNDLTKFVSKLMSGRPSDRS